MIFKRIKNTRSRIFPEAFKIYQDSFPKELRRSLKNQARFLKNRKYYFYGVFKGKIMIAILAFWRLEIGVFGEHFAVKKSFRRQGSGANLLKQIIGQKNRKIIIEVEKSDKIKSKKLIRFYGKLGFKLNKHDYLMPPYKKGGRPMPLYIMTYPKVINNEEFLRARREIYKTVYKVKE